MRRTMLVGVILISLAISAQAVTLEGGQLTKAKGEVFLSVKDSSVAVPSNLKSSLPVPEGSSIWTKKGTAKISFAGGNTFDLRPNSYCSISDSGLVIVKGSVKFEVRSADADTFSIITPDKVSRIEGTGGLAGVVRISEDGKELITLNEGSLAQATSVDENMKGALDKLASKVSGKPGEDEASEAELLSYILIQAGATGESKPASPFRPY